MRSRRLADSITIDAEPTVTERHGRKVRELPDFLLVEIRRTLGALSVEIHQSVET
jgi:hypothetical protein